MTRYICLILFFCCIFVFKNQTNCSKDFEHKLPSIVIVSSGIIEYDILAHILRLIIEQEFQYSVTVKSMDELVQRMKMNNINYNDHDLNKLEEFAKSESNQKIYINLAIKIPTGFDDKKYIEDGHIVRMGPIGPVFRKGLFINKDYIEKSWNDKYIISDHWRSLKSKLLSKSLHEQFIKDNIEILKQITLQNGNSTNRIKIFKKFINKYCRSDTNHTVRHLHRCSFLFINENSQKQMEDFFKMYDYLIKNEQLQLVPLMMIDAVKYLLKKNRKNKLSLVLTEHPSILTIQGNYMDIQLPFVLRSNIEGHLFKYASGNIRLLKKLQLLVQQMDINESVYNSLVVDFNIENINKKNQTHTISEIIKVANNFILKYDRLWKNWLENPYMKKGKKNLLKIGGLFVLTGKLFRVPLAHKAAKLAEHKINLDRNILKNYKLILDTVDTQGLPNNSLSLFMRWINYDGDIPYVAAVGPGAKNTELVAATSNLFRFPVINYYSPKDIRNVEKLDWFYQMEFPVTSYGEVYVKIFKKLQWTKVALLGEDTVRISYYHSSLHDFFIKNDVQVPFRKFLPEDSGYFYNSLIEQYLNDLKSSGLKIIIFSAYESTLVSVMCSAFNIGLTSKFGYVWFIPPWTSIDYNLTDWINSNCSIDELQTSLDTSLLVKHEKYVNIDMNETIEFNGQIFVDFEKELKRELQNKHDYQLKAQSAYEAYDSIWILALAFDNLLKNYSFDYNDKENSEDVYEYIDNHKAKLKYYIDNINIRGTSGPIKFHNNYRMGIMQLLQYDKRKKPYCGNVDYSCYFSTVSIFNFQGQPNNRTLVEMQKSFGMKNLFWNIDHTPLDSSVTGDYCSVEAFRAFLDVECDAALTILNIICVTIFAIFMLITVLMVRNKYEKKVKATRDRMKELGLFSDDNWLSLDQWEIQRDQVVLNRRLGEGAFGTVYGGEAFKSNAWIPIAVKTLKTGSSTAEKIDFLSEAELMKRFDHANIIKLIGVCTRGEPTLVIMEYMLHGDFKTYLLARRHLVGRADKEELCAVKLTKMAADVCRGMQYLADCNYVHRDLACRNCLVHENCTVKLSDFGMTRSVFDQGYYRFNRKGMLPIRWMSPEALTDGIFTTKSDVWSLGIVLYEITTFGSFPYSGMNNKQVIDHVQCGNTIHLGNNFPTELHLLLNQCWAFNPEDRPNAQDILEHLEKDNLIVPTLDTPVTAVESEGIDCNVIPLKSSSLHQRSIHRASSIHSEHHVSINCQNTKNRTKIPRTPTSNSMPEQTLINGNNKSKHSSERFSNDTYDNNFNDKENSDISRGFV